MRGLDLVMLPQGVADWPRECPPLGQPVTKKSCVLQSECPAQSDHLLQKVPIKMYQESPQVRSRIAAEPPQRRLAGLRSAFSWVKATSAVARLED